MNQRRDLLFNHHLHIALHCAVASQSTEELTGVFQCIRSDMSQLRMHQQRESNQEDKRQAILHLRLFESST